MGGSPVEGLIEAGVLIMVVLGLIGLSRLSHSVVEDGVESEDRMDSEE